MASLGSLAEVLVGDLLTEVDMKPWWETIRGYIYAVTVAVSLWTLESVTLSLSIDCFPTFKNGSLLSDADTATFSETKAAYVKSVCLSLLPWYLWAAGIRNVAFSAILLITSSYWLHHPHVINSFRSYRRVEELLEQFLLTREEMQNRESVLKILEDREERSKFEKIRNYAKKIEECKYVPILYKIRTITISIVCISFFALIIATLVYTWHDNNAFICNTQLLGEESFHTCSHNLKLKLVPLEWILAISVFGQILISLYPLMFTFRSHYNPKKRITCSIGVPAEWKVGYFIECFWKNSRPVGDGRFRQFSNYLLSEKSSVRILRTLCYKLHPQTILKDIENFVKSEGAVTELEIDYQDIIDFLDGGSLESLYFPNIESVLPDILTSLVEGKYWELLVCILEDYDGEITEKMSRILGRICLHEIGWPFRLGRSILYHALKKGSLKTQAASIILNISKDKRPVYIHCDGRSVPAEEFLDSMKGGSHYKVGSLRKLILVNRCAREVSEVDYVLPHDHLCRLAELAELYQSEPMEHQVQYKEVQTAAAIRVSRHRFLQWSDDMQLLAQKLFQNKQWMVLTELLNSFIPNCHSSLKDCSIHEFIVHSKDGASPPFGSILYYALRASRFRCGFNINAALHIISSVKSPSVLNVWDEQGNKYTAEYFVMHKNDSIRQDPIKTNRLLKSLAEIKFPKQHSTDTVHNLP